MEIKITVKLDVGNMMNDWSDEEIAQCIFDEYINTVPHYHAVEALEGHLWKYGDAIERDEAKDHHQTWREITRPQKISYKIKKRVNDNNG